MIMRMETLKRWPKNVVVAMRFDACALLYFLCCLICFFVCSSTRSEFVACLTRCGAWKRYVLVCLSGSLVDGVLCDRGKAWKTNYHIPLKEPNINYQFPPRFTVCLRPQLEQWKSSPNCFVFLVLVLLRARPPGSTEPILNLTEELIVQLFKLKS